MLRRADAVSFSQSIRRRWRLRPRYSSDNAPFYHRSTDTDLKETVIMETAAWHTRHNPIVNADSTLSISHPARPISVSFSLHSVSFLLPFLVSCIFDRHTIISLFSVALVLFLSPLSLWLTALMHLHRAAPTEFNPRGELFSFREEISCTQGLTFARGTMKLAHVACNAK